MSEVHVEQRKRPLRINENKIRTLEVSEAEFNPVQDEHAVAPSKSLPVNAPNGQRLSF